MQVQTVFSKKPEGRDSAGFGFLFATVVMSLGILQAQVATAVDKKTPVAVWTDPGVAAVEHPDFEIQGEYAREGGGLQVAALDKGNFLLLEYGGGLPGAGWDGEALKSRQANQESVQKQLAGWKKVSRKSPSLGKKAPDGAIILFAGKENDQIKGEVKDGLLWAGSQSTGAFQDFHLHLEFRLPFKPARKPSSQDRGNSGVYLFNNYEIQVLDSFGLDFDTENNAIETESLNSQWCGSFYKHKTPDLPMAFPPLTWQTYDIDFTAPRFDSDGNKTANARITVKHNGQVIHDDVEMEKGTGAGGKRPEKPRGQIFLQGHGNPTAFRNIWLLPKGEAN